MDLKRPGPNGARDASSVAPGLHRFAIVAASATFCLIFIGGLVTSTGSALAVPDWPLSFGHLIPTYWHAGVPIEYGHRVAAGTVSILTLILALWTWMAERRRWVRYTALAALGLVIFQAVLGGITVLMELPLPIAVAHAATAQAFFCLMVAIVLFSDPRWESQWGFAPGGDSRRLAPLAFVTLAIIYVQILIGAVMRHMGAGLVIPDFPLAFGHLVPPEFDVPIAVNFAHRCGAVVVTIMIIWTAARTFAIYRGEPKMRHLAIQLLALLAFQILLGATTIWTHRAVIPTTAHVAIGAAVLATSLALALRAVHRERRPDMASKEAAGAMAAMVERKVTA